MGVPAEEQGVALAPELARYFVYLLRRVFSYLSADSAGAGGQQPRDYVVLAVLADRDVYSQQELAEQLDINRTIMVKLIDRLQDAGYATRTVNPANRRSHVLSLTAAGKAALGGMQQAVRERDERLTTALSPAEHDRLTGYLRLVLGEPAAGGTASSTEHLISRAFYLLRRRGDAALAGTGLRLRHFAPLFGIGEFGPCPQQQLAEYLAMTKPAAAQIVEELVQSGLVERGQDATDRRRYALRLTDLGRQRLAELGAVVDDLQQQVVAAVGGEHAAADFHALLGRLLPVAG
jgi:DNA-binding MarR family transcriptional regulator